LELTLLLLSHGSTFPDNNITASAAAPAVFETQTPDSLNTGLGFAAFSASASTIQFHLDGTGQGVEPRRLHPAAAASIPTSSSPSPIVLDQHFLC
jgi:hypothetical protein